MKNISRARAEELREQALRDNTIALYKKCAEYALSKGIIIADTKFEFGLDENGNLVHRRRDADAGQLPLLAGRRL